MTAGRVEAMLTVPSSTTVSATNSGGGPTTVTLTAQDAYLTAAGTIDGLLADFASVLNSTRAPSSGSWTVTVSTDDGRVSIGCTGTTAIPSFSLAWTSTNLRDLLGFTRDIDYPQTAAQMATDLGYGTWTAGYLLDEASGNVASVFGSPATLTKSGSPSYSNQGPRGGDDGAVGFTTSNDLFSGGDVLDVTATDDLALLWVAYATSTTGDPTIISKYSGTAEKWWVGVNAGDYFFQGFNSSGVVDFTAQPVTVPLNVWHVGCAVIDRSTGKARIGACEIGGTPSVSTEATVSAISFANAAGLTLGERADFPGGSPTGFKFAAFYIAQGAGAAIGLSANLSTALANFAATFGTRTGTKQARGLWLPQCVLNLGRDPRMAPRMTDLRTTQSPTGVTLGLTGNSYRQHENATWTHVPVAQIREAAATYANASYEAFLDDTQFGLGHAWFRVASPVQIYTHTGDVLGSDVSPDGWYITGVTDNRCDESIVGFAGLFKVTWPKLVASEP